MTQHLYRFAKKDAQFIMEDPKKKAAAAAAAAAPAPATPPAAPAAPLGAAGADHGGGLRP